MDFLWVMFYFFRRQFPGTFCSRPIHLAMNQWDLVLKIVPRTLLPNITSICATRKPMSIWRKLQVFNLSPLNWCIAWEDFQAKKRLTNVNLSFWSWRSLPNPEFLKKHSDSESINLGGFEVMPTRGQSCQEKKHYIYPCKLTWLAGKSLFFNGRYIFIHGRFSSQSC